MLSKPRRVPVSFLSPFISTQMGLPMQRSISSAAQQTHALTSQPDYVQLCSVLPAIKDAPPCQQCVPVLSMPAQDGAAGPWLQHFGWHHVQQGCRAPCVFWWRHPCPGYFLVSWMLWPAATQQLLSLQGEMQRRLRELSPRTMVEAGVADMLVGVG